MALVMFYHLTRSRPAQTLAAILPRAVAMGWRVMLRGTDAARIAELDAALWQADGFLPHGIVGGLHDADQPILLGGGVLADGIRALALVDGAKCSLAEAEALERVWILFDGNDPVALETARAQWREITGAKIAAQYWSEDSGKWEKKLDKSAG
jgi:DNA polymerase-3 subunit chi